MSQTSLLLILASLFIFSISLIFGNLKIWYPKYIQKTQYKFFCVYSIITLVYFFAARWVSDFNTLITLDANANNVITSLGMSKVFLLDMCPFLVVCLPLALFFDKKQKIVQHLSVISIFTGSITLYALVYETKTIVNFEYIFLGIFPNKLYFIMHFNIVLMGVIILVLNQKKFQYFDFAIVIFLGGIYLLYVFLFKTIFNINWNVTGLSINDWSIINNYQGEYYLTGIILKTSFPNVYGIVIASYIGAVWGIMLFHNGWWIMLKHFNLFLSFKIQKKIMNESTKSPIADIVSYDHQNKMNWEGQLPAKIFFKAYWHIVWTSSSIWSKIFFITLLFFVLFFISLPFQFIFKKTYCLVYNKIHNQKFPNPKSISLINLNVSKSNKLKK